MMRKKM